MSHLARVAYTTNPASRAFPLPAWNPHLETTRLRRETVKNCRKGTHVILKFKWVTNKWQDKEGKERSVNEPRVKMLIPLPDTRPAQPQQPQQQAYDPWNSQPADFGANNGFDNPPF
nr:MAG TPA: Single-strand binding protein BINDING FOLD, DNA-BINDING PROTEIN.5A [Caudoviricetes sp.]